jgi:hypothetical protein
MAEEVGEVKEQKVKNKMAGRRNKGRKCEEEY